MNKSKLIKGLSLIFLIIVACTLFSRILFSSSETLTDYADKNPEIAYNSTNSEKDKESVSMNDSETSVSSNDTISSNDMDTSNRTVYKDGFYSEPLNEDMKERITGISFPVEPCEITYDDLTYLHVLYYDFDNTVQEGELISNVAIGQDLLEIFYELYYNQYQIEKIALIDEYNADDTASIEDDNTSCFNYRVVDDTTTLSKHAYGLAIDINPYYNPYIKYNADGSLYVSPKGSEIYVDRSASFPYKIDENDLCYKLFIEHGFTWGGNWNSCKDYQHFQKALE